MKSLARMLAGPSAILTATAAFAQAPSYPQETQYAERAYQAAAYQSRAPVPQQELDQILAPVALYPDSLLSQLLMAATLPREVAEAAHWSRSNPGLQGDDAVRAVENEPWDPSVKSLVAFPEVLHMMGERIDWTTRLGEAFITQQAAVMQTVQQLRRRADESGNLRSDDRMLVQREGENYMLAPYSPETVYVPYYDPRVAYGSWWWPDYQPVYWNAWPGYGYYGGIGFGWGRGIYLGRGFFYGGFDWGRRHVRYSGHRPYYFRGNDHWRGWRDDRRRDGNRYAGGDGRRNSGGDGRRYSGGDGRTYSGERAPRTQPRYERRDPAQQADAGTRQRLENGTRVENGTRHYNPAVRSASPRYSVEGASAGGRTRIERQAPVQSAPVQRAAPVQREAQVNPAARSVQPVQQAQPAQRSSGGERNNASRGEGQRFGGGEGRGRDR
jgi:hypothetical protein